ncbi:11615_t:CDS:1 [Cetraspora pellucida]|uniref:11615_t:CDS:1 n=1 Tax=Cetraspora pellucida TaxID=1433469 RepID=A0ACA9LXV7_9GLOM|nr:11615_t:CDS:1 [Cetraspora pellucida]
MTTNNTPQNISCFETLALNVLKNSSSEKIANNINIPELDPCFLCNQEHFLYKINKLITLLICGHLYHCNCIKNSIKINSTCPRPNYNKEIESTDISIPESQDIDLIEMFLKIFKSFIFIQSNTSKKYINNPKLFPNKISNKKTKKAVKKESHILKDLIKELSTESETQQDPVTRKENANSFLDLYNNITYTENQNKITNQEVITCYYHFGKALNNRYDHYKKSNSKHKAQALVNKEVRLQLPNSVSDNLF